MVLAARLPIMCRHQHIKCQAVNVMRACHTVDYLKRPIAKQACQCVIPIVTGTQCLLVDYPQYSKGPRLRPVPLTTEVHGLN